ncbi:DNA polymerase [Caloramator australicus]|uniref:DNA-directed DNA polymerase n=1 Tax=Caloramator australicus RC3 TaxID=857293 RepID=I7LG46_9CLOT|nr:DNA polymerase [Caloramator australicus]CCJ32990.1 FIG006036: phage encoded DNA polymerase I [Caloramator australicus RC3]
MKYLSIDIETFGRCDLTKCGVYRYIEDEEFEVLLFAYAFDDEEVKVVDLKRGEKITEEVLNALTDENIIKTAFNANFERTCLEKYLSLKLSPNQWRCTMVHSLYLGLPTTLEDAAEVLNLENKKMKEGKSLIKYFSVPCKPSKSNGLRTRNLPEHSLEKWETFKEYCKKDVEVEREIRKRLEKYPLPDKEHTLWVLDQKINDYGVKVDTKLILNAIKCSEITKEELQKKAKDITKLDNPNSLIQLKNWLINKGIEADELSKENVEELIEKVKDEDAKEVLKLRLELSKTSVKKYEAMIRAVCRDDRIRGLLQFYGANRTGRWAGRLSQIHNFPRNNLKNIKEARELLKSGNYDILKILFDESIPDILSQLLRTAIVPSESHRFIVSDFSAIEARVIAYLADEKWVLDTFKGNGKIYEMTASRMFNVPIEKIVKGNPEYDLRQKGKVATLACGYQGGVGALKAMGALKMGLKEEELPSIVKAWRDANPNIVKFWKDVEDAAAEVLETKGSITLNKGLKIFADSSFLFIKLPSGRHLSYPKARIEGDFKITYEGIEQGTKKWSRIKTYGGRLVENIVQAVARDCLAEAMMRLDRAGYKIAFHVHDEVVLDVPLGFGSVEEVKEIMTRAIEWAEGLPLNAECFETYFYMKD